MQLLKRIKRRITIITDYLKGLDFETIHDIYQYGYNKSIVHRSSPSGNQYLKAVFNDLKLNSSQAILDVGCGKGSALRVMIDYPFTQIDGIELVEEVSNIAIQNFKKLKENRVTIYTTNAIEFDRYQYYDIFYFYNPFPSMILEEVLRNILKQNHKNIIVVYNNPTDKNLLEKYFILSKVYDDEWGNGIHVYRSKENIKLNSDSWEVV